MLPSCLCVNCSLAYMSHENRNGCFTEINISLGLLLDIWDLLCIRCDLASHFQCLCFSSATPIPTSNYQHYLDYVCFKMKWILLQHFTKQGLNLNHVFRSSRNVGLWCFLEKVDENSCSSHWYLREHTAMSSLISSDVRPGGKINMENEALFTHATWWTVAHCKMSTSY